MILERVAVYEAEAECLPLRFYMIFVLLANLYVCDSQACQEGHAEQAGLAGMAGRGRAGRVGTECLAGRSCMAGRAGMVGKAGPVGMAGGSRACRTFALALSQPH